MLIDTEDMRFEKYWHLNGLFEESKKMKWKLEGGKWKKM